MANYSMTINLGAGEEGRKRNDEYRKRAEQEGLSLNAWIKKHLDKAAEIKKD